jgi:hypothetical protein
LLLCRDFGRRFGRRLRQFQHGENFIAAVGRAFWAGGDQAVVVKGAWGEAPKRLVDGDAGVPVAEARPLERLFGAIRRRGAVFEVVGGRRTFGVYRAFDFSFADADAVDDAGGASADCRWPRRDRGR